MINDVAASNMRKFLYVVESDPLRTVVSGRTGNSLVIPATSLHLGSSGLTKLKINPFNMKVLS